MATMVGTESNLLDMLKHLTELDFDAIQAYDAAIDRITDAQSKDALRSFRDDHRRHTMDLNATLQDLGGKVVEGADIKQVLTKGKVVVAALIGDKAILQAMKTNEDDTNTAYERAVAHKDVTPKLRELLDRNLADERRHRSWIERRVQVLESSTTGARAGGESMAARNRN